MKKIVIIFTAFCFCFSIGLSSKSLWVDKNIYSTGANLKVGDVIIVKINDISRMRFSLDLKNNSSRDITSSPDVTITGFLPKISSNRKMNNRNSTTFTGRGQFVISIAARVRSRVRGGLYRITGSRAYSINGVTNTLLVTGVVDAALVKGRAVSSNSIADFRFVIRGTKEGIKLKREKLKKDEKSTTSLTEEEKQRIILDYLEKMINELTR